MLNCEEIKQQLKDLKTIYTHFGKESQLKKLAEECSEYLEKYLKGDIIGAMEEIQDLKVLSDQFYLHELTIINGYNEKILRTMERKENGYYKV